MYKCTKKKFDSMLILFLIQYSFQKRIRLVSNKKGARDWLLGKFRPYYDTMKKLKEINGYVRLTLNNLPGIGADLVRIDEDWQEWGFPQLVAALRN